MSSALGRPSASPSAPGLAGAPAGGERAQARLAQARHLHEAELADAERAALLVGDQRARAIDELLRERRLGRGEAAAQAERAELDGRGGRDRGVRLALLRGQHDGAEVAPAGGHELERRALAARHLEREAALGARASAAPPSPRARARGASCPSAPRSLPVIFMLGVAACAVALAASSAKAVSRAMRMRAPRWGLRGIERPPWRAGSGRPTRAIDRCSDAHVPRVRDGPRLPLTSRPTL